MPRIDPLQLLKCLSVLLAPNGGIKSKEEVQRLASLMTKFSKKLVSKCIYIQILKTTKTDLLGMFMAAGGWNLIHMWLSDGIITKNWPLIQELLELLLMCPVDVERLKTNTCPKLIKGLSKDGSNENVRLLAGKLVEQWLRIVKGECAEVGKPVTVAEVKPVISEVKLTDSEVKPVISEFQQVVPEGKQTISDVNPAVPEVKSMVSEVKLTAFVRTEEELVSDQNVEYEDIRPIVKEQSEVIVKEEIGENETEEENASESVSVKLEPVVETMSIKTEGANIKLEKVDHPGEEDLDGVGTWNGPVGQLPVYKITIRDGKQVLAKVYSGDRTKKLPSEEMDTPESVKPLVKNSSVNIISKVTESVVSESELEKDESEVKEDTKVSVGAKVKVKCETLSNENIKNKEVQKKVKDAVSIKGEKKVKSSELSKDKSKEKENSKDKNKEKVREKEKCKEKGKEKEKEKIREKENKDKKLSDEKTEKEISQADRDKATLAKLIPPTISKLGKIPKKPKTDDNLKNESKSPLSEGKKSPDSAKKSVAEAKKNSISIEVRNKDASRPKTVKKFNSKFRSTGLEEEVKPPPSRLQKKPVPLPEKKPVKLPPLKRPSPPKEAGPAEKKMKPTPDVTPEESKKHEKPGSIKLIPSKPKPPFLQESDMFMDALTASSKKEPRKRKRRISSSKDSSDKKESNKEECTPPSSPVADEMKSPPIVKPALKFYQDTMEAEDEKELEENKEYEKKEESESSVSKEDPEGILTPTPEDDEDSGDSGDSENKKRKVSSEETSDTVSTENDSNEEKSSGIPKGVLVYHKSRKGPKKLVRWKPEKDLETIKYFELDETERVNVTKNFMDMKQIERSHEREALMSRKMPQDDSAEEDSSWLPLIPIDCSSPLAEPGKNSREKDVQYAREKVVLQAIYFTRSMIPDFPGEPDMEIHATTDPVIIPLDDVTGNTDSVNDFTNTPWPEPKPMIIPQSPPPQYPLPQQQQPPQQSPQPQQQVASPSSQFATFGPQSFTPSPIFPNQQGMSSGVTNAMGVMMTTTTMGGGSGDWRTGDGKVVAMGEMAGGPMEMYSQGGMPVQPAMGMNINMNMGMGMNMNMNMNMGMGMGMPSNMPGDMNYNMMGAGDDMGPGGPFPPQNFPMGGPPNMYGYQNSRGPGPGPGPNMGNMRGRGGRGGRGQWFNNQQGGGRWPGGSGSSGRGRGWSSRTVCKHFRGGYCRMQEKCPFLHPGVNGPPQY